MKDITKKNLSRGFWHGIVIVCGIVYLALALGKLTITFVDPSDYVTLPGPTYRYSAPHVYEIPTELFDRFRRTHDSEVQFLKDQVQELKDEVAVLENENKGLIRASIVSGLSIAEVIASYEETQKRVNNSYDKVVASYEKKVRKLESLLLDKPIKVIKKGESYWKVTYDIYIDYTLPNDGRVEFYGMSDLPDHLKTPMTTIKLELKTEDNMEKALVEYLKQREMNDVNIASLTGLTKFIK